MEDTHNFVTAGGVVHNCRPPNNRDPLPEEIEACRRERLVDLIVWIANDRAPRDSTVTFSERDCDVTVANHGSLEEFHERLLLLARQAGLPMRE